MGVGSKEDEPKAFETGRDGDKISGFYTGKDHRRDWSSSQEEAALELKAQKPRHGTLLPEVRPERHPIDPRRKYLAVGILAAALLLPVLGIWGYRAWEAGNKVSRASGLIVIDSRPAGAHVFLDGREVGRTPYVTPNTFQPGSTIPVRVTYPGAQDWSTTLPGGVDTSVTAELQAKAE